MRHARGDKSAVARQRERDSRQHASDTSATARQRDMSQSTDAYTMQSGAHRGTFWARSPHGHAQAIHGLGVTALNDELVIEYQCVRARARGCVGVCVCLIVCVCVCVCRERERERES